MAPSLECRMYESKYPDVDTVVMVKVTSIGDLCAYVSLLEYNNAEGMILLSELSRRRIRSINRLIRVGNIEPVMVVSVDAVNDYVYLSKRRVAEEDVVVCEDRFNKSKLVHSIMRHVAETMDFDLEFGWPLYRKYGHAVEAFKLTVSDPDSIINSLSLEIKEIGSNGQEVTKLVPVMSEEVKDALVKNIRRKMTPHPMKIRADIEMNCYKLDGVLHIKEAMRKAEAASINEGCPVQISVVASPLYALTTHTLNKKQGISVLGKAIAACAEEIQRHDGKLILKEAPRVVSERVERLMLAEQMGKLGNDNNKELSNDEDSDEDGGMGDIDFENPASRIIE